MPLTNVYNMEGEVVTEVELNPSVFGTPVNAAVLHQVVTVQLLNRRQGNASTKTRSMVSGSTKKLYRQKGTGRARQGSIRAPHRRGGGVVFGNHGQFAGGGSSDLSRCQPAGRGAGGGFAGPADA